MKQNSGMTLLEIIIVIALIAFVYSIALPQFANRTGADAATKLSRLQADIRTAYDMAILNGKTFRFVFEMASGNYHLEESSRRQIVLSDDKQSYDPSEEQEKDQKEAFEQQFKEFKDVIGEKVTHPDKDKEYTLTSPVLEAKEALSPTKWDIVKGLEWGERTLGPYMLISEMQTEHHSTKQILGEMQEKGRTFLYVFPEGRVERAFIKIAYRKGDRDIDEAQMPYILTTDPYSGTSELVVGQEDVRLDDKK